MIDVLPLVDGFAKDTIRERHWEEAIALSKHDIPYASENFVLKNLLDANLLKIAEDCEDIADNADKQFKLETQLKKEISAHYDSRDLTIMPYQGAPATIGGDIQEIQQEIEEHLQMLQQFAVMRHVGPFRNEVKEKISILSHVSDTIERWLKVQNMWQTLVTVFIGGDIAKQLPQESQRF
jgi:dynein heavy chain, axonemal